MTRTVQLRRYRIVPGAMDDYLAWFGGPLLAARTAFGFRVEFAYPVPDTDEFVWAVSAEGDEAAFATFDADWTASDERRAAFAGQPQRVESMLLQVVHPLEV